MVRVMAEGTVTSKPAIRRRSRDGLLFGGIGIATGALVASSHLADVELFAKKEPSHFVAAGRTVAIERTSHFAGFAELVRAVKPAVIAVLARTPEADMASQAQGSPEGQRPRFTTSQGSGFFISADGYAVTSNHVVKGSVSIEIHTDEGESYKARVVGADAASDLAVIKVDARRPFVPVRFAEEPPQVGDWIIAVGNPFGLGGTVTAGIVSARGRDVERESDSYQDLLQIDAPINKGNSGGPTFDIAGKVVGVNTIILSPTGGSVGIAFAIPSDKAKLIAEQLKDKGAVNRFCRKLPTAWSWRSRRAFSLPMSTPADRPPKQESGRAISSILSTAKRSRTPTISVAQLMRCRRIRPSYLECGKRGAKNGSP